MISEFHAPFSPVIMVSMVPDKFVEIVNERADIVLNSEVYSAKFDWSDNLVGKVHKEVLVPVKNEDDREFLFATMKDACIEYLKKLIENNTAQSWNRIAGDAMPTRENIHLTHSWVVSQYAGEYNPWHNHSGDFSAVLYLKIPPKMNEEWKEDWEDHYPANGLIEFAYGEAQDFRIGTFKVKPEVGKLLMFPSYLKHYVYPFKCEGERRSMSFNAHMMMDGLDDIS